VFEHLAPGGYFELQGVYSQLASDDGTAEKATNAQIWIKTLSEGLEKFGKPVDTAINWAKKLKDAGFVDVQQEVHKVCNF
jgi:hypothetical protein